MSTIFITLTYPDCITELSPRQRGKHRYLFLRAMEAHLKKKFACIWRIEWKPRKTGKRVGELMPHFHLLCLDVDFVSWRRVREWWRKAIGMAAGNLCTDVRRVTGELGACKYIAKYLSKQASLDIHAYHNTSFSAGRHWGITRKSLVPMCQFEVARKLTLGEVDEIMRHVESVLHVPHREYQQGFTLYGHEHVNFFKKKLK